MNQLTLRRSQAASGDAALRAKRLAEHRKALHRSCPAFDGSLAHKKLPLSRRPASSESERPRVLLEATKAMTVVMRILGK